MIQFNYRTDFIIENFIDSQNFESGLKNEGWNIVASSSTSSHAKFRYFTAMKINCKSVTERSTERFNATIYCRRNY